MTDRNAQQCSGDREKGREIASTGQREHILNSGKSNLRELAARAFPAIRKILACVFVWTCLVKLPSTVFYYWAPDSYEPVLSYAAAHHLQWGRDIAFTYGPLGFLTSDCYWGNFFWLILLWAGAFALMVTVALMPLLARLPGAIRLAFYAALPLVTVPSFLGLGFDPIRILSIAILGIGCLPGERPGPLRLITTGFVLTVLSFTKFTYCIYFTYTFIIIAASNRRAFWSNTAILAGSSLVSFLSICAWSGQNIANIFIHVFRGFQMAGGYSAAMAIPAREFDLAIGIAVLILLPGLVLTIWFGSGDWRGRTDRVAVLAAGIALAWKEGFTRAEIHVFVFFVYALLLAPLLPALLGFDSAHRAENPLLARLVPGLSAVCLLVSFAHLVLYHVEFSFVIRDGLVDRNRNTLNAFLRPAVFKVELERCLQTMRQAIDLPEIRAAVGTNTIGSLNFRQDLAILNGLNYVPHPVFENYAAYTPELQRLNSDFFKTEKAPEYLFWNTGTMDSRFPTLDAGEVVLRTLNNYSPIIQEKGYLLWKRKSAPVGSYCLSNERESYGSLDQWVPIPAEPTWLRIECKQSLFGAAHSLLCRTAQLRLEVQLDNGEIRNYRLLPGNAKYGFVISPFLRADYQLTEAARNAGSFPVDLIEPPKTFNGASRVVAARVQAGDGYSFQNSIRIVMQTIDGIWSAEESKEISIAR